MNNCFMMIFTAMSGIGAIAAVFVSIIIFCRQKRIALFDRRTKILNDFEQFVFVTLPDWDWDGNVKLVSQYARDEVVELFDESFGCLQDRITETAKKCNSLIGDIKHAQRKGECHGKADYEIEQAKVDIENSLQDYFKEKRSEAYKKWLRI